MRSPRKGVCPWLWGGRWSIVWCYLVLRFDRRESLGRPKIAYAHVPGHRVSARVKRGDVVVKQLLSVARATLDGSAEFQLAIAASPLARSLASVSARSACSSSFIGSRFASSSTSCERQRTRSFTYSLVGWVGGGMTASVSGLLGGPAHMREARSRCLRYCRGVTVVTRGRPPHRAREGHGLLIGDLSDLDHPDADHPGPESILAIQAPGLLTLSTGDAVSRVG
jgi:hypothetical protein